MTDKISPAKKTAKADDRNLIASEDSQTGLTLEERLFAIWQKYRTFVYGLVVVILLVIVDREVWKYMQAEKEADTREAYGNITTSEQRLAFAREHAGHPLAGAALLSIADEAYKNRDYAKARTQYSEAVKALSEPVLVARARLGEGMSALQSDNPAAGVGILEGLADDTAAPETLRTETLYHLATHADSAGDPEKARAYLDKLDALNPTGVWVSRASALRARLPVAAETTPAVTLPGG